MEEKNSDADKELLLKEIEHLRKEIDDSIKESRTLERYSLLSTGAVWSWFLAKSGPTAAKYETIVWIPAIIIILFGLRSLAIHKHLSRISDYIILVEKEFSLPESLGWEEYLKTHYTPFYKYTSIMF